MKSEFSVFGKSLIRKDAVEKVKGEMKYIPDIHLPRMLHAKFLRSPHAHARITTIDTSKAEAMPGVKCILTHRNVPKVHPYGSLSISWTKPSIILAKKSPSWRHLHPGSPKPR